MPQRMVLTIDEGKFNIEGPLENKFLCYGMLGLAMEAVQKHEIKQIVRPPAGMVLPPTGN